MSTINDCLRLGRRNLTLAEMRQDPLTQNFTQGFLIGLRSQKAGLVSGGEKAWALPHRGALQFIDLDQRSEAQAQAFLCGLKASEVPIANVAAEVHTPRMPISALVSLPGGQIVVYRSAWPQEIPELFAEGTVLLYFTHSQQEGFFFDIASSEFVTTSSNKFQCAPLELDAEMLAAWCIDQAVGNRPVASLAGVPLPRNIAARLTHTELGEVDRTQPTLIRRLRTREWEVPGHGQIRCQAYVDVEGVHVNLPLLQSLVQRLAAQPGPFTAQLVREEIRAMGLNAFPSAAMVAQQLLNDLDPTGLQRTLLLLNCGRGGLLVIQQVIAEMATQSQSLAMPV